MRPALLAAVMLCLGAAGAAAQTAEETVAYLLFGVEDGAGTRTPDGPATWRLLSTAPASYLGTIPGKTVEGRFLVVQRGPCRYEAGGAVWKGGRETGETMSATIDFERITAVRVTAEDVSVEGPGLCVSERGAPCTAQTSPHQLGRIDPERRDKAYAHLRNTVCPKRGF